MTCEPSGNHSERSIGDETADRLRLLADRLNGWAVYYDNADTDPNPDEARRHAWRQQMQEIVSELRRCGIPGDSFRPMIAGIHAVGDLDEGRTSPLLQRRKKAGGQSPLSKLSIQRGVASAAVTLHIKDGAPEECALKKVASCIASWPAAVNRRRRTKGKHQSLEDALKDWREKAKAGGSSPDAVFYVRSLELFEESTERYGTSHGDFANSILTDCNKLYR
jgi:hypothetical protein